MEKGGNQGASWALAAILISVAIREAMRAKRRRVNRRRLRRDVAKDHARYFPQVAESDYAEAALDYEECHDEQRSPESAFPPNNGKSGSLAEQEGAGQQQPPDRCREPAPRRLEIVFAGAVAVFTAVSVGVSYLQWSAMREALEMDRRAWVFPVGDLEIVAFKGDLPATTRVAFVNGGPTPAYVTETNFFCGVARRGEEPRPAPAVPVVEERVVLFPNTPRLVEVLIPAANARDQPERATCREVPAARRGSPLVLPSNCLLQRDNVRGAKKGRRGQSRSSPPLFLLEEKRTDDDSEVPEGNQGRWGCQGR